MSCSQSPLLSICFLYMCPNTGGHRGFSVMPKKRNTKMEYKAKKSDVFCTVEDSGRSSDCFLPHPHPQKEAGRFCVMMEFSHVAQATKKRKREEMLKHCSNFRAVVHVKTLTTGALFRFHTNVHLHLVEYDRFASRFQHQHFLLHVSCSLITSFEFQSVFLNW
jgi:hypothetical protein